MIGVDPLDGNRCIGQPYVKVGSHHNTPVPVLV
jgi:hypothetical protein